MTKKLPSLFANKIDKPLKNNSNVYYSTYINETSHSSNNHDDRGNHSVDVYKKINDIFNSRSFVYKADVDLLLNHGRVTKTIVGRNEKYLVTMNNELIPIESIIDIKKRND